MTSDLPVIGVQSQGQVVGNDPSAKSSQKPTTPERRERYSPRNAADNSSTTMNALEKRSHLMEEQGKSQSASIRFPILRNGTSASQRAERCQVLKVKFGNESVSNSASHTRDVPPVDTRVEVDHQHYEQWARVPTRRTTNSVLLRGIQHLKAKMKREGVEEKENDFLNNVKVTNAMIVRDKTIDDGPPQGFPLRRERSSCQLSEANFPKPTSATRDFLKPYQHVIDAEMFESEHKLRIERLIEAPKPEVTSPRDSAKEQPKPRLGISRLRDRCPVPMTMHQPMHIGDHVFLINDPSKNVDFPRSKTRTDSLHPDFSERTSIEMTHIPVKTSLNEAKIASSLEALTDGFQRSRSFFGSFPPKKTQMKRTPAVVSSAEVFDFSQLVEIRRSNEQKVLERQKTESSFSVRPPRSSKWVPRGGGHRMKEHIH